MIKKAGILLLLTCISVGSVQFARADSLVIKYKNGEKQVIELKDGVDNVLEFKFQRNKYYEKASEYSKKSATKHIKNTEKIQNTINFGNEIKGKWETPNPYMPPANE